MGSEPPPTSADQATHRAVDNAPTKPSNNHILCGRGNVHTRHPGNKRFARIVQESAKEYAKATSRSEKIVIVTSAVSLIRNSGMKFMNFDPIINEYVEIESERYHGKVSHAIRDYIKKNETASRDRRGSLKLSARKKQQIPPSTCSSHFANEVGSRQNTKASNKVPAATTNVDGKKNRAVDRGTSPSDDPIEEKKRLKMDPTTQQTGVASPTKPGERAVFSLSQSYESSAFARNEDYGLESARIIFDLGDKIADNKLPLLPYEDEIFSSLSMSPLSDISELLQFEEKGLGFSHFVGEGGDTAATASPCPSLSSPYIVLQTRQQPEETMRATVYFEQNVLAPPPISLIRGISPLPIDSQIEFEEGDLENLASLLA